ncbi:protein rolling stone isoform X2 [Fopius arisanus]|uniref:Protein rolling stone isoform X2 n=1 Tax=Fopius arisanus TaxID=64838 RepID=A0A0C9QXI8_9HYME|nr:PREDICTED: protein rolling stone-like isoform X2 [Fopius arisanus]
MVITRRWGTVPLRRALTLTFQNFACRRAMVNNIWCRKLSHIWHQKVPDPHARAFSEPRWSSHVSGWYLGYRWLISLTWMTIIICSIFEVGSVKPLGKSHLWPIYLTNWDLALGFIQSLLGLLLVIRRWRFQKSQEFDAVTLKLGGVERIYWFLYTITSSLALGVTGTYWATVYNPKIHQVDLLNILLHVCNSFLMIVDIVVTRVPLRLRHCWWCLVVVSCYLMFTIIYYSAGGLDKQGNPRIYAVLDWAKPGKTILVCLGGLTFLVIIHCLLCYIVSLRDRLYERSQQYLKEQSDPGNQQPLKVKTSEVV